MKWLALNHYSNILTIHLLSVVMNVYSFKMCMVAGLIICILYCAVQLDLFTFNADLWSAYI